MPLIQVSGGRLIGIIARPADRWAEPGFLEGQIVQQTFAVTRLAPDVRTGRPTRVLLLAPSRGLGGGIERYVETLEWAFADQGISCQRLDLSTAGVRGHAGMVGDGRRLLRSSGEPTRLIVGHRAILPVATVLAREPVVCGTSVLCHGSEGWDARLRPRRGLERALMRRPGVRAVAVSSFTAGTLARDFPAAILPPGLSREWFKELVVGAASHKESAEGIQLVTAFRLDGWRQKGLPEVIEAVTALARDDVYLTICGTGEAPPGLLRLVAKHSWCTLHTDVTDRELAGHLSRADLFILATRTRPGRRASGEGFGLVLLEAQVAGTPVIAPAYGGCVDAYVQGVTGISPSDETAGQLGAVLGGLLQDQIRLRWMGERAAGWAREAFAPGRYAQLVSQQLL